MGEFEKAISDDRVRPPQPVRTETGPTPEAPLPSAHADAGAAAAITPITVDVVALRESMKDPKVKLMEHVGLLQGPVDWKLPGNCKERVAPQLLIKLYATYGSMLRFAEEFIREKELENNHVANEVVMLALVLDKQIASTPSFLQTESCEIVCRRIYALKRAFAEVKKVDDWRQPKGTAANKWRSKVRWDLANEIDWRAITSNDSVLPGVERELQDCMHKKAVSAKYLAEPAALPDEP